MRRHVLPIAAIHDKRLRRAQSFRGPGGVHRGVAAAVDHDSASQHGLAAGSHVAQQRYRIEHPGGVARRYVDMLCEMRADRHKNGVELSRRFGFQHILDFTIENDLDAEVFDAFDLGHEIGARKSVRGDTEMQHPAGQRSGIVDFDVVTEALEMIPCRQPPGPAPTTRTRFPDGCAVTGTFHPLRDARSPRKRSTAWMLTALSSSRRLQALSHGW